MPVATLCWSNSSYQPGKAATLSWDVVGAASDAEAVAADGIIQANGTHPFDASLVADAPTVTRPGFNLRRVTTSFSVPPGGSKDPKDPDPLKQPWKIRWQIGTTSEPFNRDTHGNVVANAAGDSFDPPPPRDFVTLFLTITRNEPFFDLDTALYYSNTVNLNEFTLGGKYTVKPLCGRCLSILPEGDYLTTARYVPVAYNFEFRRDGFRLRLLNQGQRGWYVDAAGVRRVAPFTDAKGEPVTKDILLKADGTPVEPEYKVGGTFAPKPYHKPLSPLILRDPQPDGSVYLKFDQYDGTDFTGLRL